MRRIECDVVVVSQSNQDFRELISSNLGKSQIVDLVRLFKDTPERTDYHGIGW